MNSIPQIVKNCGNFSERVLPGMIAYGQETEKGRGKLDAAPDLSPSEGYITSEADILICKI